MEKQNSVIDDSSLWYETGSRIIQTYSKSLGMNVSSQELYESFLEGEFETEEIYDYFEEDIINMARAWIYIKQVVYEAIEYKQSDRNISDFKLRKVIEVYSYLDPHLTYMSSFSGKTPESIKFLELIQSTRNYVLTNDSKESILEYLLIFYLDVSLNQYFGYFSEIFAFMIVQGILMFKGITPITLSQIIQDSGETYELHVKLLEIIANLKVNEWSQQNLFKEYLKRWISKTEKSFDYMEI
ncbi:hypothetical protein [Spiroplasma culicicola]|uniref:Uncharacterized protein n=1 Tax=Spiroplasma culicicola AES-1 TaxID=1276246 RepID=W6A7V8_9MOLU|nr:hypothetical protein [Spiroplasma culicicola]AHI53076.1 hypothetical protein SCULI_v1c07350 [Spiroplasma culicicola AES-1]